MPSPEDIFILSHTRYAEEHAPELVQHEIVTARLRLIDPEDTAPMDRVAVTIDEVGLVQGKETFSTVRAQRLGRGTMHVIARAIPQLTDLESVEKAAISFTEEILATETLATNAN